MNEKLTYMDEDSYPVLKVYLYSLNNAISEEDKYSLNNLNLFNNVLNLINEKYSNNISRDKAEKTKLIESEIFINNKKLLGKFFNFFNNLNILDNKGSNLQLCSDNFLIDFL